MSGLALPRHIAVQRALQKRSENNAPEVALNEETKAQLEAITGGKDTAQDLDTPIPEGLPCPGQWRVMLMPMSMRLRSKRGILYAPETLDTQNWTHCLWRVCGVGPLVYRGPAWSGFTEEELAPLRPKVGDLYLVDPKQPRRFHYKSILFITVNDDQLWAKVDPAHIEGLEFRGLAL
jgi:hypothetical protein